jgi:uncharacterized protein YbjT (DUF2867 family)
MTKRPVLVTGATGYIGGRLVPVLLERGYAVRCLVRDRNRVKGREWEDRVEIAIGDVLKPETLPPAMAGCGAAYYLVHSMEAGEGEFARRDLEAAQGFSRAADEAGLERIIYLGGLGRRTDQPSAHLSSRHQVGQALRSGRVPATELRAAMIIGSGSASFEMMRALVKRLPVMICPKWVKNRTQPIAVRNVLDYLVGCLEHPETAGQVYDIGGPEILSYKDMMLRFAGILGKRRWILVVPVLTPRLSAYWANLVTPVPASLAFPLIEGLRSETICEENRIRDLIPTRLLGFDEAVNLALERIREKRVQTRWTNARGTVPAAARGHFDPARFAIIDQQRVSTPASVEEVFQRVRRIGGDVGWYCADLLWEIRGWIDRLIGGVGLRRGRRDPDRLVVGEALDFWRVEDFVEGERLLLRAEMKVPGEAWLEFRVQNRAEQGSELIQTAYFDPYPFWGHVYWYLLYPVHWLIFRGMARRIARGARPASRRNA